MTRIQTTLGFTDSIYYRYESDTSLNSFDLSNQDIDLAVYETLDNFADAPSLDRYSFVGSALANASYTSSGDVNLFNSLIEVDYELLKYQKTRIIRYLMGITLVCFIQVVEYCSINI